MGRKRLPKNQLRREVISISLKPSTISKIDQHISYETSRSKWIESIVLKHLENLSKTVEKAVGMTKPLQLFEAHCEPCDLWYEHSNEYILREKYCERCFKKTEWKGEKEW